MMKRIHHHSNVSYYAALMFEGTAIVTLQLDYIWVLRDFRSTSAEMVQSAFSLYHPLESNPMVPATVDLCSRSTRI